MENRLSDLQVFSNLSNGNYRIFVKEMLLEIGFIEIGFISSIGPLLATLFVQFWFRKNNTTYVKTRQYICELRQNVTMVTLYVLLNQNNVVTRAE